MTDILCKHGHPFYIKIDVEHMDSEILDALFSNNIYPDYISAESHTLDVFNLLASKGGYQSFKLVDGRSVAIKYARSSIYSIHSNKEVDYSFPFHSAGPFGEDIEGQWMSSEYFYRFLAIQGLGWKDIHATRLHKATLDTMSDNEMLRLCELKASNKC